MTWWRQAPARRARLPGINVAGKTGTTNAYRDAWFVGFTGNFTTAVWLGNDNYEPTNRLTGGILPAATWAKYMRVAMAYEKPDSAPRPAAAGADRRAAHRRRAGGAGGPFDPGASGRLAAETSDALGRLEERFKKANAGRRCARPRSTQSETAEPVALDVTGDRRSALARLLRRWRSASGAPGSRCARRRRSTRSRSASGRPGRTPAPPTPIPIRAHGWRGPAKSRSALAKA